MLRPSAVSIALGIVAGFASLLFFSGMARAYALPGTAAAGTPVTATSSFNSGELGSVSWQSLTAPFQNFMHSLQSIGTTDLKVPTVSVFSDAATQTAHGAFEQFDTWLAGVIGFHIGSIVTISLQLMSWLLGLVKNGVDWALSWIH